MFPVNLTPIFLKFINFFNFNRNNVGSGQVKIDEVVNVVPKKGGKIGGLNILIQKSGTVKIGGLTEIRNIHHQPPVFLKVDHIFYSESWNFSMMYEIFEHSMIFKHSTILYLSFFVILRFYLFELWNTFAFCTDLS